MTQCAFCGAPEGKQHATRCELRVAQVMDTITKTAYPNSKNGLAFAQGMEFQDFVVRELNKHGLYIQLHTSKKYQFECGESVQMAEIKLDRLCTETGRLSIEVEERTSLDKPWVISGIYRDDRTIFYIQGNFTHFWLFDRRVLQRWHTTQLQRKYIESPKESPTVRKFYIPILDANEICIWSVSV